MNNIVPISVGRYSNINIKNSICNKVIYCLKSNNLIKTHVLLYNNTYTSKKFVQTNNFIYLEKLLIIYLTLILINYLKSIYVVHTIFLIFVNIEVESRKKIRHNISSYINFFLSLFY